ncbi:MAG TPA: hypothetical protein VMV47_11975 [Bacteroidales bacterium]|nr:hypothetical protein [Bacteroidales bacterium]
MKTSIRSIIIVALLFSGSSLKSQEKYQPGYIVTNNGDTIRGMICDRKQAPFAQLYSKIRFKGNSLFKRKYSPSQITGYKLGATSFESEWINSTSNLFRTNYICDPASGTRHFLKVIVKGYLTYYQWEYMDQESWSIDAIDLFKRENDEYYIRVTRGIFGIRLKNLKEYFMDCPALIQEIERGELKTPAEIAYFYNNWIKCKRNK